ncbi:MAG: nucleotide pyrophosphohydrolase [Thermoplasmatota archaeon]
MSDRLDALRRELKVFVDERDWEQYHTPKDLAVSLVVEAGELLENFQWTDPTLAELKGDAKRFAAVQDEVADVLHFALLLCDRLGLDPVDIARAKLAKNRERYPIERSKGNAKKWNEL